MTKIEEEESARRLSVKDQKQDHDNESSCFRHHVRCNRTDLRIFDAFDLKQAGIVVSMARASTSVSERWIVGGWHICMMDPLEHVSLRLMTEYKGN